MAIAQHKFEQLLSARSEDIAAISMTLWTELIDERNSAATRGLGRQSATSRLENPIAQSRLCTLIEKYWAEQAKDLVLDLLLLLGELADSNAISPICRLVLRVKKDASEEHKEMAINAVNTIELIGGEAAYTALDLIANNDSDDRIKLAAKIACRALSDDFKESSRGQPALVDPTTNLIPKQKATTFWRSIVDDALVLSWNCRMLGTEFSQEIHPLNFVGRYTMHLAIVWSNASQLQERLQSVNVPEHTVEPLKDWLNSSPRREIEAHLADLSNLSRFSEILRFAAGTRSSKRLGSVERKQSTVSDFAATGRSLLKFSDQGKSVLETLYNDLSSILHEWTSDHDKTASMGTGFLLQETIKVLESGIKSRVPRHSPHEANAHFVELCQTTMDAYLYAGHERQLEETLPILESTRSYLRKHAAHSKRNSPQIEIYTKHVDQRIEGIKVLVNDFSQWRLFGNKMQAVAE